LYLDTETSFLWRSVWEFIAESFFKTLKTECIYQHKFINKEQAALIVFEFIEIWYNRKRLHSALGYLSPAEFERKLNKLNIAA
jgi:putative transposase